MGNLTYLGGKVKAFWKIGPKFIWLIKVVTLVDLALAPVVGIWGALAKIPLNLGKPILGWENSFNGPSAKKEGGNWYFYKEGQVRPLEDLIGQKGLPFLAPWIKDLGNKLTGWGKGPLCGFNFFIHSINRF